MPDRHRCVRGASTRSLTIALGVATAVGILAFGSARASAATYSVWYCFDRNDKPVVGAERDWSGTSAGLGYQPIPVVTCPGEPGAPSGAISTEVDASPGNAASGAVHDAYLYAPQDVTLRDLTLWWEGLAINGGQVTATAIGSGDQVLADYRETDFPPGRLGNPLPPPLQPQAYALRADTTRLRLESACLGSAGTCQSNVAAYLRVHKAMVTAVDNAPPQGTASGALLTDPVLSGTPTVTVDASDKGAGLYVLQILVDGQVQTPIPFGGRPCSDVDPSNSDPFEFSSVIPCPIRKILTAQLDTSQISDDAYHHVQLQLVDAAGNVTILAERVVGVDSRPPLPGFFDPATRRFQNPLLNLAVPRQPNGAGAGSGAILRVYLPVSRSVRIRLGQRRGQRRRVTRPASKRTVHFSSLPTLRGVLLDAARRPIAGAKLWIASRPQGQEWQITGPPFTTSRKGHVGLRLRARSPSRQVNLVYFPFSDSHEQAVGRPVELDVRAGVALSISRGRVHNGERVSFSGRVAGPLARRGVTVSLQVRLGRRYRTFRAIRVTPSGRARFRTAYRFRATSRTTRYSFRALVPRQAGMPFERGVSPTRTVVVAP
jgi:hypothetical protein